MTLRTRVALLLGVLVAASAAVSGVLSYTATRTEALSSIDAFLDTRASLVFPGARLQFDGVPPPPPLANGDPPPRPDGSTPSSPSDRPPRGGPPLSLDDIVGNDSVFGLLDVDNDVIVASQNIVRELIALPLARGEVRYSTVGLDGASFRVRSERFETGAASVNARSLDETNATLAGVRTRLLLVSALVTVLAALAGFVLAGFVSKPLRRLSRAAENVAESGTLSDDLDTNAKGEVGQLATSFERMLTALSRSREQQQRLIVDASHELRTPLTTIRANIDMLAAGKLDADDAARARDLIRSEIDELTNLSSELSALASVEAYVLSTESLDLVDVARSAVDRAIARHGRGIELRVPRSGSVILDGNRAALDRAISNLVGNAVKFSEPGTLIVVRIERDRISVIDHGRGIPPDDLGNIFERFHRAEDVRNYPGSGLGLSIVRETARSHGGSTFARNHPRGATIGFTFRSMSRST